MILVYVGVLYVSGGVCGWVFGGLYWYGVVYIVVGVGWFRWLVCIGCRLVVSGCCCVLGYV